jgi:putative acetyltransferase
MHVTFRRATNHDCALAQRIIDGALREYGLHVLLDSADADLTDIERSYDARGGAFEIVERESGEPLGVLAWRPATGADEPILELKKLYLTPAARGRGVGGRALQRVIDVARSASARAIVLETAAVLAEANRLYASFGFRPVHGSEAASFAMLSEQCDLAYRLDLAWA